MKKAVFALFVWNTVDKSLFVFRNATSASAGFHGYSRAHGQSVKVEKFICAGPRS